MPLQLSMGDLVNPSSFTASSAMDKAGEVPPKRKRQSDAMSSTTTPKTVRKAHLKRHKRVPKKKTKRIKRVPKGASKDEIIGDGIKESEMTYITMDIEFARECLSKLTFTKSLNMNVTEGKGRTKCARILCKLMGKHLGSRLTSSSKNVVASLLNN